MSDKKIEITEELLEDGEEQVTQSEFDIIMEQLGLEEELKRIQKQDNPIKCPKEIKNNDYVKNISEKVYAIGESFQILIGYGIDYNNAVAISSNIVSNEYNKEMTNIQAIKTDNQQL